MIRVGCIAVIALLIGCSAQSEIIDKTKESLRQQMKDPSAVQFKDVKLCPANKDMVVGDYNSKNAYGGYEGFRPFYGLGGIAPMAQFAGSITKGGKSYDYHNQMMLACFNGSDPDAQNFLKSVDAGTAISVEETTRALANNVDPVAAHAAAHSPMD